VNQLAKLKWQCRRGMKELDLLLENYLATDYLVADTAEKARFIELLQLEDDELFAVLMSGDRRNR
jgi:antitoxin CptB